MKKIHKIPTVAFLIWLANLLYTTFTPPVNWVKSPDVEGEEIKTA